MSHHRSLPETEKSGSHFQMLGLEIETDLLRNNAVYTHHKHDYNSIVRFVSLLVHVTILADNRVWSNTFAGNGYPEVLGNCVSFNKVTDTGPISI